MCLRSSITTPNLVRLGFHPPLGRPKMLSFLSVFVCLCVCHAPECQNCAPDFAMKALEHRNDFNTVGQGKVCSYALHLCSTFSDCCQLPTPQCAEFQKNGKIWVFHCQRVME